MRLLRYLRRVSHKESSISLWNVNRTSETGRMFGADWATRVTLEQLAPIRAAPLGPRFLEPTDVGRPATVPGGLVADPGPVVP